MKVLFVAGFAPIPSDLAAARRLYIDGLGLPLRPPDGDYPRTEALDGVKHFGLWTLRDAARSCFGTDEWPPDVPTPQATIEFEVEDVEAAARELEAKGHHLLHPPQARALEADRGAPREPRGPAPGALPHALAPRGRRVGTTRTGAAHGVERAARPRPGPVATLDPGGSPP